MTHKTPWTDTLWARIGRGTCQSVALRVRSWHTASGVVQYQEMPPAKASGMFRDQNRSAPSRIRTYAPGSGGRCSIP